MRWRRRLRESASEIRGAVAQGVGQGTGGTGGGCCELLLKHEPGSNQVLQILESLRYQHEVVKGCRLLAKSVTDPMDLHTLIQAVQAPNDRAEVAEHLTKVQQKNLARMRRRAEREH